MERTLTGVDMAEWQSLGGNLRSNAAAASWGDFEVEVFAIHTDGQLWNRYWDGESWHQWEPMGGDFVGQPAASARDADRIDVLAIDNSGVVQHRYWNGKEWVPWHEVEGSPRNAKGVTCAWSGPRLDVFVRSSDDDLWYRAIEE
jgi:hypothetical protein